MRTSLVLLVMMLGCATTAAQNDAIKVPAGCRAAEDAKASRNGYADRVIHETTGIEMILVQPGKFIMGKSKYRSDNNAHPVSRRPMPYAFYRPVGTGPTSLTPIPACSCEETAHSSAVLCARPGTRTCGFTRTGRHDREGNGRRRPDACRAQERCDE